VDDARVAAARYGRSPSDFYPEVSIETPPGHRASCPERARADHRQAERLLAADELTWTLLTPGAADRGAARQQLLAANFSFNRKMQDVVRGAARTALDGVKGSRAADQLGLARSVREAREERLALGLATQPEVLLTRQVDAKAVRPREREGHGERRAGDAALALGIPRTPRSRSPPRASRCRSSRTASTRDDAAPARLDLANAWQIRAGEAAIEEGRPIRRSAPTHGRTLAYRATARRATRRLPNYAYTVNLRDLFKGFDRLNAIREAEAERDAARADFATLQLETTAAVWRAYQLPGGGRSTSTPSRCCGAGRLRGQQRYGLGLSTVELLTGERIWRARATCRPDAPSC
jgi:hypothetical protein